MGEKQKKKKQKQEKTYDNWYIADFETTVYEGQTETEVWAAAIVPITAPDEPESVKIFNTISTFMWHLSELARNESIVVGFHNLRFDGSFILNFLKHSKYWQEDSYELIEGGVNKGLVLNEDGPFKMRNGRYRYAISEKNQWYTITLKTHGHLIEIRDTLKILPFSVRQLGGKKGFDTKHKKLEMDYENHKPGCRISKLEEDYIKNDVLVVKESLALMLSEGHDSLTIGSCCLKEFQSGFTKKDYAKLFPNLYEITQEGIEQDNVGEYIRKSYKGGWCYVVPEKAGKEFYTKGTTCDVNSLYPSMQLAESGNRYPIGLPTYWQGEIPEEALINDRYYFVHIKTRFYIKENMLPTVQIKGSYWYPSREWLKSSDVIDYRLPQDERYKYENRRRFYIDENGKVVPALADLYLTMTDWEMLQKHYDLYDTQFIDGMWFETGIGLFDTYIKKYAKMKIEAKSPARRTISKLFANNLYGKMSASPDSSYRMMFLNEDNMLRGYVIQGYDKTPGYIPVGSAITSYARRFTITAAQKNYYGPDKPGFIYADTDSIHCDLLPDEIIGAPKHPTAFCHWKYETCWDYAKFIRAKTYVEHVTHENEEPIEKPYYNLKCAGMSDHCKELFLYSVGDSVSRETLKVDKLDKDELEFIKDTRTMDDFDIGLEIPGMLKAKNIKGGTLLVKSNYKMRKTIGD